MNCHKPDVNMLSFTNTTGFVYAATRVIGSPPQFLAKYALNPYTDMNDIDSDRFLLSANVFTDDFTPFIFDIGQGSQVTFPFTRPVIGNVTAGVVDDYGDMPHVVLDALLAAAKTPGQEAFIECTLTFTNQAVGSNSLTVRAQIFIDPNIGFGAGHHRVTTGTFDNGGLFA